jgi:aminoglycoside phosphotransferase
VVHVVGADDRELYLKVVAPTAAASIAELHTRLRAAGVPAPAVLDVATDKGIVSMEALRGPTLRELLKVGAGRWPSAREYLALGHSLASVDPSVAPGRPGSCRATDAMHHAAMLARVLPADRQRIERLTEPFEDLARRSDARATTTIHGDLYEAQLVVDDGRVVGLLDLDDVRCGDTYDDLATVIAHLLARALDAGPGGPAIRRYAERLRDGFSYAVDRRELDLTTAAVLVGLATGPFRVQQRDWKRATRRHLSLARRLVDHAGERSFGAGA